MQNRFLNFRTITNDSLFELPEFFDQNVSPTIDLKYDLGDPAHRWRTLYAETVTATTVLADNLVPLLDEEYILPLQKDSLTHNITLRYDNSTIRLNDTDELEVAIDASTLVMVSSVLKVNFDGETIHQAAVDAPLSVNLDNSTLVYDTLNEFVKVSFDGTTLHQPTTNAPLAVNLDAKTLLYDNTLQAITVNLDNNSLVYDDEEEVVKVASQLEDGIVVFDDFSIKAFPLFKYREAVNVYSQTKDAMFVPNIKLGGDPLGAIIENDSGGRLSIISERSNILVACTNSDDNTTGNTVTVTGGNADTSVITDPITGLSITTFDNVRQGTVALSAGLNIAVAAAGAITNATGGSYSVFSGADFRATVATGDMQMLLGAGSMLIKTYSALFDKGNIKIEPKNRFTVEAQEQIKLETASGEIEMVCSGSGKVKINYMNPWPRRLVFVHGASPYYLDTTSFVEYIAAEEKLKCKNLLIDGTLKSTEFALTPGALLFVEDDSPNNVKANTALVLKQVTTTAGVRTRLYVDNVPVWTDKVIDALFPLRRAVEESGGGGGSSIGAASFDASIYKIRLDYDNVTIGVNNASPNKQLIVKSLGNTRVAYFDADSMSSSPSFFYDYALGGTLNAPQAAFNNGFFVGATSPRVTGNMTCKVPLNVEITAEAISGPVLNVSGYMTLACNQSLTLFNFYSGTPPGFNPVLVAALAWASAKKGALSAVPGTINLVATVGSTITASAFILIQCDLGPLNLLASSTVTITAGGAIPITAGGAITITAATATITSAQTKVTAANSNPFVVETTAGAGENFIKINSVPEDQRVGIQFEQSSTNKIRIFKDTNDDFVIRMEALPGGAEDVFRISESSGQCNYSRVFAITNDTNSTSTTSGAFRVAGGASIEKNLWVGEGLLVTAPCTLVGGGSITSTVESTSTSTGSLVTAGGVGIAKNLYVGGTLVAGGLSFTGATLTGDFSSTSTTESSSITTGAIVTSGGVGIAKSLFVGEDSKFLERVDVTGQFNAGVPSDGVGYNNLGASLAQFRSSHPHSTGDHSGTLVVLDNSTTIGASGGLGGSIVFAGPYEDIGSDFYGAAGRIRGITLSGAYGGNLTFETATTDGTMNRRMTITHDGLVGINNTSPAYTLDVTGTFGVSGVANFGSTLNVAGSLISTSTTDSTTIATGAFVTGGGVGIAKNLTVGGRISLGDILTVTGAASLPVQNNTGNAIFAGGQGGAITGRLIIGDGTGWSWRISQRVSSTTADLFVFRDRAGGARGRLGINMEPNVELDVTGSIGASQDFICNGGWYYGSNDFRIRTATGTNFIRLIDGGLNYLVGQSAVSFDGSELTILPRRRQAANTPGWTTLDPNGGDQSIENTGVYIWGSSFVEGTFGTGYTGAATSTTAGPNTFAGGLAVNNTSVMSGVRLPNATSLDLGFNVAGKETNAGRIGYGLFGGGTFLDVVGAGTTSTNRQIRMFEHLTVASSVTTAVLNASSASNYGGTLTLTTDAAWPSDTFTYGAVVRTYTGSTPIITDGPTATNVVNALGSTVGNVKMIILYNGGGSFWQLGNSTGMTRVGPSITLDPGQGCIMFLYVTGSSSGYVGYIKTG